MGKKSKNKTKHHKKQAAIQATVEEETVCVHGAVPSDSDSWNDRIKALMLLTRGYIAKSVDNEGASSPLDAVAQVCNFMRRFPDLIDMELTRMVLSESAESIIVGDVNLAISVELVIAAIMFKEANDIGVEQFLTLMYAESSDPQIHEPDSFQLVQETILKVLGSPSYAFLYTAKHVPCDCLSTYVKRIKLTLASDPKAKCECPECQNKYTGRKLMCCSACDFAWYCSEKCQKAHWSKHKGLCKYVSSRQESTL